MGHLFRLFLVCLLVIAAAQIAGAQWTCLYATYDDDADGNAIGTNTSSVGLIKENMFVALAGAWTTTANTQCFLIPYVNADSATGRKYGYGYGTGTGIFQVWTDGGFDQVQMFGALKIKATPDSLIYVANNDPDHNILVFKYVNDTITVVPVPGTGVPPRQQTGTHLIHGIDVDQNGYVYVCNDSTVGATDDIKVYKPVSQWTLAHTDAPVSTVNLPDGAYEGITASPDGKLLFVCDYGNRKVLKYKGTPTGGYTADAGFSFTMPAADSISPTIAPRPMGLAYLPGNNILAVACHAFRAGSAGYTYGKIYFLNPNTGAFISADTSLSEINTAQWNFIRTGAYQTRTGGIDPGNASGYTSTYDVKWDANKNLYTLSFYGWTVDKWRYAGTLPTFTVTGVEEVRGRTPEAYTLAQNYPNPFNPATTIEFTLPASAFVTLKVYDLLGREVMQLVNEQKAAGTYRATFDASHLPSGTYFYSLTAGAFTDVKKMTLVK